MPDKESVFMKQKKLMLLGGSHYLMPAIEAAHGLPIEDVKTIAENVKGIVS